MDPRPLSPTADRLAVVVPAVADVSITFTMALVALTSYLTGQGVPVSAAGAEIVDVASVRRYFVEQFLDSDVTHLLWLDADIVVDPSDALVLFEDRRAARVVSGLYRKRSVPYAPQVYDIDDEGRFHPKFNFDMGGLTRIGGAGMGCCLVDMDVYREMSKHFGDDLWYLFTERIGEDLWFFRRLAEMGEPVYLDGRVRAGHETRKLITVESGWVPEAVVFDNGSR